MKKSLAFVVVVLVATGLAGLLIPAPQAHASFNAQQAKNVEWATTHGCMGFTTGPGAPDKSYKDRDGYCFIGLDVDPNQ
jgi:hypothetical protein